MSVQIRPGDTLSALAARYGTTVSALLAANPQIKNPNLIYAGQAINLPGSQDSFEPAPSASGARYTVRSGDTLGAIGAKFGLSYQAIASANGISNPNLIYVGQSLVIPGKGGSATPAPAPAAPSSSGGGARYTVQSGDTLGAIGARFGVSYQAIAAANGISNPNLIYAGQSLIIPGASGAPAPAPSSNGGGAQYTVQPGDTLGAIGARFGVPYQSIAAANGITNPNRIYPGQVLTIPGANAGPVQGPGPIPGPVNGGISSAQLRAIMPNLSQSRADQLLPYLNQAMIEGGINTPLRQAAFLAQLAHESVGLTAFEEYASGAAYEGRADLGNIYPGDGVRYKGRGPIQLTGRNNYRAAGQALGIDLENNPTRAADPDVGFRVAVWFWNSRNLSAAADVGNFDYITYRINGGYNGKASRDTYYARAKSVLGV